MKWLEEIFKGQSIFLAMTLFLMVAQQASDRMEFDLVRAIATWSVQEVKSSEGSDGEVPENAEQPVDQLAEEDN